jgi:hypothetical protein
MAKIVILGTHCRAELTEPDEDGDYSYEAACGAVPAEWGYQPIGDMIMAAGNHVDQCLTSAPPANHPNYE